MWTLKRCRNQLRYGSRAPARVSFHIRRQKLLRMTADGLSRPLTFCGKSHEGTIWLRAHTRASVVMTVEISTRMLCASPRLWWYNRALYSLIKKSMYRLSILCYELTQGTECGVYLEGLRTLSIPTPEHWSFIA